MSTYLDLPAESQVVKNAFFGDDDATEDYVVLKPGHILFLTNGGVRICHWEFAIPRDRPMALPLVGKPVDVQVPGVYVAEPGTTGPWGAFLARAMEQYPDRIRTGVAPDAPRHPCPFDSPA